VEAFAKYYLSLAHRNDLAGGCAMTTLSPEVARASPEMREAYEAKMTRFADLVADGLAGGSQDKHRSRAWAMLGVATGGLTMARAVQTRGIAEEIAEAIKGAAVKIAGPTQDCSG